MSSSVPTVMWDIALAETWNTTPWDVRENATVYDIVRQGEWVRAQESGEKMREMRDKQEREMEEVRNAGKSGRRVVSRTR